MKLKFLLPAALCLSILNTGHAVVTNLCCDLTPSSDGSCKCYADPTKGCANCYTGSGDTGCTDCESTSWTASGTEGYVRRTNAVCLGTTCNKLQARGCAWGWYGNADLGGCTRCPSSGGVYGTTIYAGNNNTITDCYIPGGTVATDGTGTFE